MKIFRWGGLIGFVVFTALLLVIGFFFIDGWIKKAVEVAGFSVNGAEVNVESVDLKLSPIGFKLSQVEIADSENPSRNAVEFGEMNFDMNLPQLFLGNVRISDLTIADVQTNVERKKVAKVAQVSKDDSEEESAVVSATKDKVNSISSSFPEPSDVVSEQTQNTKTAVNNANETISQSKKNVDDSISKLPGDDQLASYKTRIDEIKAIELDSLKNIQKSQALIQSVGKDMANDKLAIETVKLTINKSVSDGKKSVEAILRAPAEDWEQLKETYPLNKDSAMKVAQLLLGESFFEKIEQGKYWYGKAKPWLARLKSEEKPAEEQRLNGEFVAYDHPNPTAKFQLDHALLSLVADNWPWELTIDDVSTHTGDLYTPVRLNLRRGDVGSEALLITGLLDQLDGKSKDSFSLSGKGIDFASQSIDLAGTELKWTPAGADVVGQLVATNGSLDGVVSLVFPKNEFTAQGTSTTSKYIASAVETITAFKIDIKITGDVKKPKFNITSDLDQKLSSALGDVAKEEYEAWLKSVKGQLDDEVAKLRKPVDQAYSQLENKKEEAQKKIDDFEKEVEAQIKSLEAKAESEKQRLENKAKAEVDAAKAKLEAEAEAARKKAEEEKRKAEAAAKKAAEDKLKAEADKLKGKLKF
jgi:uncharacterized protein (TIGR03545 family)